MCLHHLKKSIFWDTGETTIHRYTREHEENEFKFEKEEVGSVERRNGRQSGSRSQAYLGNHAPVLWHVVTYSEDMEKVFGSFKQERVRGVLRAEINGLI